MTFGLEALLARLEPGTVGGWLDDGQIPNRRRPVHHDRPRDMRA